MRINYKFHAIAIAIISAVIVVLFMLFGPKTPEPAAPRPLTSADSYVRIVGATWGLNCNSFIESAMAVQAKEGLPRDDKGNVLPSPLLKKVESNNVLERVKSLCDNKVVCTSRIDSAILDSDPANDCYKQLDVSYRCFDTDRMRTTKVGQGETLTINCSNPTASNATTKSN
jgi:hypothetical protein